MAALHSFFKTVHASAEKRWYLPLIGALAGLDAYIFVVPNEALLIPSVMARKKHWMRVALWMTIGSAIGATSFALLTSLYGELFLSAILPGVTKSQEWRDAVGWVQKEGAWGLALISLSPLPQHIAVAVVGLAHLPLWKVFLAILGGRGIKYGAIAWCTVRAPGLMKKFRLAFK